MGRSVEPKDEDCAGQKLGEGEEKEKVASALAERHVFHEECIEQWFQKKIECPLCRANFDEEVQAMINRRGGDEQRSFNDIEEARNNSSRSNRLFALQGRALRARQEAEDRLQAQALARRARPHTRRNQQQLNNEESLRQAEIAAANLH